jgi:hypothetical protein
MKIVTAIIFLGLMIMLPAASHARTWHVPSDAPTIQAGIDSASDGDVVELGPRIYTGPGNRDMSFNGKAIVVEGCPACLPSEVIIDLQGSSSNPGRAFTFDSGEGAGSVLRNLTILNGYIPFIRFNIPHSGGAIRIDGPSPTINRVDFRDNYAFTSGGAVQIHFGLPTFTDCRFIGNSVDKWGGAMNCDGGSVTLTDCIFDANFTRDGESSPAGAALSLKGEHAEVLRCIFVNNIVAFGGGAVLHDPFVYGGTANISECDFRNNTAPDLGSALVTYGNTTVTQCNFVDNWGVSAIHCQELPSTFYHCMIVFNAGIGLYCAGQYTGNPVVDHCNTYGNLGSNWIRCDPDMGLAGAAASGIPYPGEYNISEDPMFCGHINSANGCTLDIASPCAARNSLCGHQIGLYGVGCSGPVKTRQTTWGAIKAIYR